MNSKEKFEVFFNYILLNLLPFIQFEVMSMLKIKLIGLDIRIKT